MSGTRCDNLIRMFLYGVIFFIPYSTAAIESCVGFALLAWACKRFVRLDYAQLRQAPLRRKIAVLWQGLRPVRTFLDLPIFLFLLACGISVAHSGDVGGSLRAFFSKTTEWFVVYYLIVEVFTTREHVRRAMIVFLSTALVTSADALWQFYMTGVDLFRCRVIVRDGATAGFVHPNSLAGYLTTVIPLVFALFLASPGMTGRKFAVGLFVAVLIWSLGLTFSRAAIIVTVLVLGWELYFFFKKQVIRWPVVLAACGLGICLIVLFRQGQLRQEFSRLPDMVNWRKGVWQDSWAMIKDKPVLGHGLNRYMTVFKQYQDRLHPTTDFSKNPTYAHNCFIQVWAETGIFGLLTFAAIFVKLLLHNLRTAMMNSRFQNERVLCLGLTAGAAGFLLHSIFDTNFYSVQLSLQFWVVVSLSVAAQTLSVNGAEDNGRGAL